MRRLGNLRLQALAYGGRAAFRDEGGAAAIEFALLVPILVFACLATVDIGLAISKKMEIDYSLRMASEGAIADLGEDEVHDLLDQVASENFTVSPDVEDDGPDVGELDTEVLRFCACPESMSTVAACTSGTCGGAADPYLYYRLSGEMYYDAVILPQIPMDTSLLVQVE